MPDSFLHIRLPELLRRHKQVSYMSPVTRKVRKKMDTYCTCEPGRMILDLRGKMAAQVQKDLRTQLVQDLKEGSDEAAFVCKQLGLKLNAYQAPQGNGRCYALLNFNTLQLMLKYLLKIVF